MPRLSPLRDGVPQLEGLTLVNRGKVCDSYDLGVGLRLLYRTDGVSIFDFVLNALVPEKGMVLTALSHFWLTMLESHGVKTHMVAAGVAIDHYLPEDLRSNPDIQARAMVVRELRMHNVEFIMRACLTGTGLREYKKSGTVCGIRLPLGLQDGDLIGENLFTPTTKADEGHDEPVPTLEVMKKYPQEAEILSEVFAIIQGYAREHGIVFADSKFEFGLNATGGIELGDEVGTPDSSRFWNLQEWEEGRRKSERRAPNPYDKELVREWGLGEGINKLDPKDPEVVAKVHALQVPEHLIRATTQAYRYILWRLTGRTLEQYFAELGVNLPPKRRNVAIVLESRSDLPGILSELEPLKSDTGAFKVIQHVTCSVISCHRNPYELMRFAQEGCGNADVVIVAGGMAFALPGVLDAWLHRYGKNIPVIGVVLGVYASVELVAATLSIEQLPGRPVVLDVDSGAAFCGRSGFHDALMLVEKGELPPPRSRTEKEAEINIDPFKD